MKGRRERERPTDRNAYLDTRPWQADDSEVFRLAQLVLLLSVASELNKPLKTVDRLGYYDFFAANPFVVIGRGPTVRDRSDWVAVKLAGFTERQLSYASTGQRWVSRRRRLQRDLARLVALGLVTFETGAIDLTRPGIELSKQLLTVYADGYRTSARIVMRRLNPLSDAKLTKSVQQWLGESWLDVDLLDDVTPDSVMVKDGSGE
ncbi:hypothetical protein CBZ_04690 [Cellulomonas biazotea]|uniref:Uncharacterized protein n=1 Tax=Cellulomonas biazotea TaxID=1709 RepID=A0A402DMS0_9CELL|nr:hypothetical protein CBZ_04690 [Cellulomonas biazotea]